MGKKKLLVIGAHSADFVWRAGWDDCVGHITRRQRDCDRVVVWGAGGIRRIVERPRSNRGKC